jgi:hypothetical protein
MAAVRDHSTAEANGSVGWQELAAGIHKKPPCPRLANYWMFDRCGYDKGSGCCSEPEHVHACPLPRHRLRNGRLNQTAYRASCRHESAQGPSQFISFLFKPTELADPNLRGLRS